MVGQPPPILSIEQKTTGRIFGPIWLGIALIAQTLFDCVEYEYQGEDDGEGDIPSGPTSPATDHAGRTVQRLGDGPLPGDT